MTFELIKIERRDDEFGFEGIVAKFGVAVSAVPAIVDVIANRIDEIFVPGPWCAGEVAIAECGFAWAQFDDCSASINSDNELEIFVSDPASFAGDDESRLSPENDWACFAPIAKRFMSAVA